MKTTLNIDDSVMAHLKREAAQRGCTMSELVESALRLLLRSQKRVRNFHPSLRLRVEDLLSTSLIVMPSIRLWKAVNVCGRYEHPDLCSR